MLNKSNIKAVLDRVLTWPPERQDEVARMLHVLEAQEGEFYHPTDEEWAAITEGYAEAKCGEFVPNDALDALWARHGL